jgi:hypothetical protein
MTDRRTTDHHRDAVNLPEPRAPARRGVAERDGRTGARYGIKQPLAREHRHRRDFRGHRLNTVDIQPTALSRRVVAGRYHVARATARSERDSSDRRDDKTSCRTQAETSPHRRILASRRGGWLLGLRGRPPAWPASRTGPSSRTRPAAWPHRARRRPALLLSPGCGSCARRRPGPLGGPPARRRHGRPASHCRTATGELVVSAESRMSSECPDETAEGVNHERDGCIGE